MRKTPTKVRNCMQSPGLRPVISLAGNFYKCAAKPCRMHKNIHVYVIFMLQQRTLPCPGFTRAIGGRYFSGWGIFPGSCSDFGSIRTAASDSEGRWFESSRAYVKIPRNLRDSGGLVCFGEGAEKCMRYMVGAHDSCSQLIDKQ